MRTASLFIAAFLALGLQSTSARGQVFQLLHDYRFGDAGSLEYAGDLNGDGFGDVVAISGHSPDSTYVLDGITSQPICPPLLGRLDFNYLERPSNGRIASPVADFTGDGVPEFFLTSATGVLQMIDPTNGSIVFQAGGYPTAIGLADVDGDGIRELLIGRAGSPSSDGSSNGYFDIKAFAVPQFPTSATPLTQPPDHTATGVGTLTELRRRGTSIDYALDLDRPTAVHVEAFDASGRRLADIFSGRLSEGRTTFAWDGRDSNGQEVASGSYIICVRAGNSRTTTKPLIIR